MNDSSGPGFGPVNAAFRKEFLPRILALAGGSEGVVYWRCVRCGQDVPTEVGPPSSCPQDQGGCGRPAEDTRFDIVSRGASPSALQAAIRKVAGEEGLDPASLMEVAATSFALSGEAAPTDLVTLDALVEVLQGALHFRRREDYVLIILWACQSWLGPEVLPEKCLAYVVFTGPRSSGKSTATEIACLLAGGTMIAGGSEAAIRSILDGSDSAERPRALGIDEIDVKAKQLPDLEGIFRTGNRWTAEYPIRVPTAKGRGWETRRLNIGGPKVLNYRTDPEDALASRTVVIEMAPHRDARMIVDGLFENESLLWLRETLRRKAEAAKARWDKARLEQHMKSLDFVGRVERLDADLPRGLQLGAVLLAVSDAIDVDAEDVIAGYVAQRREDSLQAEREVLADYLRQEEETHRGIDGVVRLENKDVHAVLNARLRDRGLPPVGVREWPRVRRELGIEAARRGRGLLLIFGPSARKALGIDESAP